jgi:hypothetical protein
VVADEVSAPGVVVGVVSSEGVTVLGSSVVVEDDSWCVGGWRSITVEDVLACFESKARPSEDIIKTMAVPTVTLLRKVPGPRLPKTVWDDPPKEAPISAPFPACSKMEAIIRKQAMR